MKNASAVSTVKIVVKFRLTGPSSWPIARTDGAQTALLSHGRRQPVQRRPPATDPAELLARHGVDRRERRDGACPMVNPLEIMPVLALAIALVLLPLVADRP